MDRGVTISVSAESSVLAIVQSHVPAFLLRANRGGSSIGLDRRAIRSHDGMVTRMPGRILSAGRTHRSGRCRSSTSILYPKGADPANSGQGGWTRSGRVTIVAVGLHEGAMTVLSLGDFRPDGDTPGLLLWSTAPHEKGSFDPMIRRQMLSMLPQIKPPAHRYLRPLGVRRGETPMISLAIRVFSG